VFRHAIIVAVGVPAAHQSQQPDVTDLARPRGQGRTSGRQIRAGDQGRRSGP
jgi:hypothetical protein